MTCRENSGAKNEAEIERSRESLIKRPAGVTLHARRELIATGLPMANANLAVFNQPATRALPEHS